MLLVGAVGPEGLAHAKPFALVLGPRVADVNHVESLLKADFILGTHSVYPRTSGVFQPMPRINRVTPLGDERGRLI